MASERKRPIEILTVQEINRLVRACTGGFLGLRNRAMISMMYRGGLRLAELLDLKEADVDPEQGTIRILCGKGAKSRTIGLDPRAFWMVVRYQVARKKKFKERAAKIEWLFVNVYGQKMKPRCVQMMLKWFARKAKINKRVHPHGLRHSMAAQLAKEGVPLNMIQAQLGHSNVATTSIYLDHIAPVELVRTMQRRKWADE